MKDGILLVHKPVGMTSREVVNFLMKKLNTRKMGHTGTLDPFAEGLMIVTVNKGTKISSFIEEFYKSYLAELTLGASTDTLDCDGRILEEKKVELPLDAAQVRAVLESFKGEIEQIPPMYSAIKVDGEELYKKARRGEEIARKARRVIISDIRLISIDKEKIVFSTDCSKGTYIRTLGADIAERLNYPGHLTSLTRLKVGRYNLKMAKTPEEIEESDILSIGEALQHLPSFTVTGNDEFKVKNGCKIALPLDADICLIKDKTRLPLAIYRKEKDDVYACLRGLIG